MPKIIISSLSNTNDSELLYVELTKLKTFNEVLNLDCSALSWVDASSTLSLVLLARLWLRWTGYQTHIIGLKPDVHTYFQKLRLFDLQGITLQNTLLCEHIEPHSGQQNLRLIPPCFLPSHPQANLQVMDQILDNIENIIVEWFGEDKRLLRDILQILSELGENIQHSQDYAYLMLQRYKKSYTADTSRIVISIVDLGLGIRYSLGRQGLINPNLSDSDCILQALKKGITGTGKKRGVGLDEVRYRVLRSAEGSELRIRSGQGAVLLRPNEIIRQDNLSNIPGVQIYLSIEGRQKLHGWI